MSVTCTSHTHVEPRTAKREGGHLQILLILFPRGGCGGVRAQVQANVHASRACVVRVLYELLEHADARGVVLRQEWAGSGGEQRWGKEWD